MLIASAIDAGVHRLALIVVSKNKVMIALYEKFGFEIEGEMRDTLFGQDENYHDMLIMGKIC